MHAARAGERNAVELLARQAGGGQLLAGARVRRLDEPEVRRASHGQRELRRILAREAEQNLRVGRQRVEPSLLLGGARERRIADVVRWIARRRQQVSLEAHVEPIVDCSQTLHELVLDGRCDHDGHHRPDLAGRRAD